MKRLLDVEGQQLAESLNWKGEKEGKTGNSKWRKRRSRLRADKLTAFEGSHHVLLQQLCSRASTLSGILSSFCIPCISREKLQMQRSPAFLCCNYGCRGIICCSVDMDISEDLDVSFSPHLHWVWHWSYLEEGRNNDIQYTKRFRNASPGLLFQQTLLGI